MEYKTPQTRVLFGRCHKLAGFLLFVILLLSATFTLLTPRQAAAVTNSNLNFQARLMTAGGGIVPDGNYNIEFKIYNASTSGTSSQGSCTGDANCLWTETRTSGNVVTVKNGYLTVNLGSVTALPNIDYSQQLWLTMRVGSTSTPSWDPEMNPRLQLTATPYAFKAGDSATLGGLSSSGFIQNTTSPQASSNFNISGNGTVGGTLTAGGDINTGTAYRVGGTLGSTTTCSGGQLLQNAVIAGGITTGGTCAADGGVTTVGTFSATSIANGASISGSTITLGVADGTNPGMLSTTTQTIAGAKTFTGIANFRTGTTNGLAFSIQNTAGKYALNLDSVSNLLSVGDADSNMSLVVGNTFSTATQFVRVGNNTNSSGGSTVTVGSTSASSSTTITGGSAGSPGLLLTAGASGNINLGTVAQNQTIQIGTTATNTGNLQTIGIGNLNAAGSTDVTIGTGSSATSGATTVQAKGALTLVGVGGAGVNVGINAATNINTGGSTGLVTIGGGSGTFALNTTNIDISAAGAITGATGITSSGTIAATTLQGSTLVSTVAIGTAPLTVTSTTKVANLNADLLDGFDSTGFIQNTTSPQSSNLYVQAATSGSVAGILRANAAGSGDILELKNGAGTSVATFGSTGSVLFKPSTDSATAFQVQPSGSATPVLDVDTTNSRVGIGTATPLATFHTAINNTSVVAPMALLEQAGTGDSSLEFRNPSASFFLGQDTSTSNSFVINSVTAATPTSGGGPGTISFVQSAAATGSGSSPLVLTRTKAFTSNNTAGNLIVVAVSFDTFNTTNWSCSDSQGNTYAIAAFANDTTNDQGSGICYAKNIHAGANTVTLTISQTTDFVDMSIYEYSGADTTAPLDVTSINSGAAATGSNAVTSGSATTTQNNDLVFGTTRNTSSTNTITAGTSNGFTGRISTSSFMLQEDKTLATAGSTAATFTYNATNRHATAMATFKSIVTPGTPGTLTDDFNNPIFKLTQTGALTLQNSTNSSAALQVNNASGTSILNVNTSDGSVTINAASAGYTQRLCHNQADGSTANLKLGDCAAAGQADLAEFYDTAGSVEPGDIVAPSSQGGYKVQATDRAYQPSSIGIVSTNPTADGIIGNNVASANRQPVALAGRVPLKVSLENGPITIGDPLAASSTPGAAMKATGPGQIIGYALENYSSSSPSLSSLVKAEEDGRALYHATDLPAYRSDPSTWVQDVGKIMVFTRAGYNNPVASASSLQGGQTASSSADPDGSLQQQLNDAKATLNGVQSQLTGLQSQVSGFGISVNTGALHAGSITVANIMVTGMLTTQGIDLQGDLQLGGHIITKGDAPELELQPYAGIDHQSTDPGHQYQHLAKADLTGNDTGGKLTVTIGDPPQDIQPGDLIKVKFNKAFSTEPQVVVSARGKDSAQMQFYINEVTKDYFTLAATGIPLPGATYTLSYYAFQ